MEDEEEIIEIRTDEFSKPRSDEEDEKYLEILAKEAMGGEIDTLNFTDIKDEDPEQPEIEIEEEIEEEVVEEAPVVEEPLIEEPVEVTISIPDDSEISWDDPFEEEENCALKKYIFGIARDYVDMIDKMDYDERTAYVNDAINLKIEQERIDDKKYHQRNILIHIIITIMAVIIGVPTLFWAANKSIDVTVANYQRTQENWERLYREKAKKDAMIRNSRETARKKRQ